MDKIYSFLVNKISDFFPAAGGAVGAVTQVKQFEFLPSWEAVTSTIIISIIGGALGYLVKLFFDILFCKVRKKYKV